MSSVNPFNFGRSTCTVRRYSGSTGKHSIFRTLSREIPKCLAATRSLIPSRHARRTLRFGFAV